MLVPGMLADLAILPQDIFEVPLPRLPETTSVLTVIGGRIVHDELSARPRPPAGSEDYATASARPRHHAREHVDREVALRRHRGAAEREAQARVTVALIESLGRSRNIHRINPRQGADCVAHARCGRAVVALSVAQRSPPSCFLDTGVERSELGRV
jgi:hypothetical protein